MIIQSEKDVEGLRVAGRMLAEVLHELASLVTPGVTTASLDMAAESAIRRRGASPAFLGYKPEGANYPFPAVLCVSVNEEIVHGIPRESVELIEGDIVTLDLGLSYDGYFVDSAVTVGVGEISVEDQQLLDATREALDAAIAAAHGGVRTGDIGAAIEEVAKKHHFSIVEDLGGHAVGAAVHEQPYLPNFGKKGKGDVLPEGMVIALEPMLSLGSPRIVLDQEDEWTYRTADGSRAAHFEHTLILTREGCEVVTKL
ncbi:MAG: type I methionyl aminopeptidase [Patescibacteria group bacterium]